MKTFFIALVLGIFIGALVTGFLNDPEAFEDLFPKDEDATELHGQVEEGMESVGDAIQNATEKAKGVFEGNKEDAGQAVSKAEGDAASPMSDALIRETVIRQLKLKQGIDASAIAVDAQNGKVTLSGKVASEILADEIIEIALATQGVNQVDSQLQISPSE